MSISVVEFLKHIRDEAQFLDAASASMSVEQFVVDPIITRAPVPMEYNYRSSCASLDRRAGRRATDRRRGAPA